MNKIILSLIVSLLFITNIVIAQEVKKGKIDGRLTDVNSKLPLEYATISLYRVGEKKPITGTTTDKSGNFILNDIPFGSYNLLLENIGYSPLNVNDIILNESNSYIHLQNKTLSTQSSALSTVTVTGNAQLIQQKVDKMVFNAEKDLTSQGGDATDLLKKIPQVSVDVDGNVQLQGNGGIRFLIDGKPSAAFGNNMADVLQSIPASQIKSIEIITNPSAKYDAQGIGGIINIILKSKSSKGYSGSASVTAATRNAGGNFSAGINQKNIGLNVFVNRNDRIPLRPFNDNHRETTKDGISSKLDQYSQNRFQRHSTQAGMGFDWKINKFNTLTSSFSYNTYWQQFENDAQQLFQADIAGGSPIIQTHYQTKNKFSSEAIDLSLTYKKTFTKEEQELDIKLTNSNSNNNTKAYTLQSLMPKDSLIFGNNNFNPGSNRLTELSLDYTHPFAKDVQLGVGGKASLQKITGQSFINSYDPNVKNYYFNNLLSNELSYDQKIWAAYSELTVPLGNDIQFKSGLRYERTEIDARFSNAQNNQKVPSYNTFVPSVFLSRKMANKQSIRFSYSKRIQRPEYEALNPFYNTTDPKNISTGNPFLSPEIAHRFEATYTKESKIGSFTITGFYRINDDDIQPFIKYYPRLLIGDSTYENVSLNQRLNAGKEFNTGADISGDLRIGTKFNIRGSMFFFHRKTINKIDAGLSRNSFNYRMNINATYQFTNSFLAEFFSNFNGPRNEAQGRYPSFTTYNIAVRKQFWNKKGSFAITTTNIFSKYLSQMTVLEGPGFKSYGTRNIPFQAIGINFTWKFGKMEFKKEKRAEESEGGGMGL